MKNLKTLGISLFVIMLLTSCGSGGGNKISSIKLIPVKSGKEFQFIDNEGKIVINPQFSKATVFRDGLALVKTSGDETKWGYIDKEGKFTIIANYNYATVFSDGLAWVVLEKGAPTAIDKNGEIKFTLIQAEQVKIFKDGLAAYSTINDEGEKWGFVDKEGKTIINPQFTSVKMFNDKKCAVQNDEGKWGYINTEGSIIINYQFDNANNFVGEKAVVISAGKAGVIDDNGKYIINPQFASMLIDGDMFLVNQNGKLGWTDKEGNIIINPQFSNALPFLTNDLAAVQSGKTWGYIDKEGKIVINPQFEAALPFNDGQALVVGTGKIGFIDTDGKYIINPQFDDVSSDYVEFATRGSSIHQSVRTDYEEVITEEEPSLSDVESELEDTFDDLEEATEEAADMEEEASELFKINDPDGYTNLRDKPKGNVLQKVYEDEVFEVLGEYDGYKKVQLSDGTIGFIHKSRVISLYE